MTHLQALAALAAAEAQVKWWHEFANERIREKEAAEARADKAETERGAAEIEREDAHNRADALAAETKRLTEALRWALGEVGDWPVRYPDRDGPFYWRTELRRRAALKDAPRPPDSPDTFSVTVKRVDPRHIPEKLKSAQADNPNPKEVVPSAPHAEAIPRDGRANEQHAGGAATPGAAPKVGAAPAPDTAEALDEAMDAVLGGAFRLYGSVGRARAAPLSEARPAEKLLSEEKSQPGTPVDRARAVVVGNYICAPCGKGDHHHHCGPEYASICIGCACGWQPAPEHEASRESAGEGERSKNWPVAGHRPDPAGSNGGITDPSTGMPPPKASEAAQAMFASPASPYEQVQPGTPSDGARIRAETLRWVATELRARSAEILRYAHPVSAINELDAMARCFRGFSNPAPESLPAPAGERPPEKQKGSTDV